MNLVLLRSIWLIYCVFFFFFFGCLNWYWILRSVKIVFEWYSITIEFDCVPEFWSFFFFFLFSFFVFSMAYEEKNLIRPIGYSLVCSFLKMRCLKILYLGKG